MQIKIHNPNKLPTIDYREVLPLQGKLKNLTGKNYEKLKGRLVERGFTVPLFLWKSGKKLYLMDGHQRQRVMLKEDMYSEASSAEGNYHNYEVPYILIEAENVKDAKAQLLEITSQYGQITQEGFTEYLQLAELPEAEILETTAFDGLFKAAGSNKPDTEEDEPPEVDKTQVFSKPGAIYKLGEHRVMCGDTLLDTPKLMGDKIARMTFTDPPWNVAIGLDSNPRHRQRKGLDNDNLSAADFEDFINGFAGVYAKYCSGDFYCVLGASEWPTLDRQLRANGFHWSATIIWVKDMFVLGRSKYHRRYEPLWYGWHESAKSSFTTKRDLDDVWEIPRPRRSEEHPTMKPIELCAQAIVNSSNEGDIVLDLFLGSGSTLIAAEQTERICYGMELDPRYVDVIRKRYATFIGKALEWEKATPEI